MKKLILMLFILSFSNIMYAQFPELPKLSEQKPVFNIYQNVNGVPDLFPSKTIIYNNGNYDIYKNVNGLQDFFPYKTIELKTNGSYDVYDVKNGLKSILPIETLKPVNSYNNQFKDNFLIRNLYNDN